MNRWTTPDPMGLIDGPNTYVFVKANPINKEDILGLFIKYDKDPCDDYQNGACRKQGEDWLDCAGRLAQSCLHCIRSEVCNGPCLSCFFTGQGCAGCIVCLTGVGGATAGCGYGAMLWCLIPC